MIQLSTDLHSVLLVPLKIAHIAPDVNLDVKMDPLVFCHQQGKHIKQLLFHLPFIPLKQHPKPCLCPCRDCFNHGCLYFPSMPWRAYFRTCLACSSSDPKVSVIVRVPSVCFPELPFASASKFCLSGGDFLNIFFLWFPFSRFCSEPRVGRQRVLGWLCTLGTTANTRSTL